MANPFFIVTLAVNLQLINLIIMFSTGQLYFAIFFVIVFTAAIIYTYRKDLKSHKLYYKGSTWIFLGFLAFIGILFVIKTFLKE